MGGSGERILTLNLGSVFDKLGLQKYSIKYADLILTGSWQYGTANDDSDFDLVLIHDHNIHDDLIDVGCSKLDMTQQTGTFKLPIPDPNIEHEYDIRFLSYTAFIRKLYSADINCVEYICSPYSAANNDFTRIAKGIFMRLSLDSPFYRYRILRSLMGFMSPINRKKSKKFIIPEKVNQNNLIKIANLYYLIRHRYYPLNPQKGIDSMMDDDGNTVELIDATSPYYNSTEIMNQVLENYNAWMEQQYVDDIKYAQFPASKEYTQILTEIYLSNRSRL